MTQKQIIGVLCTVFSVFVIYLASELWNTRDVVKSQAQTIESRAMLIPQGNLRFDAIEADVTELKRLQGLYDLELRYSKQDRDDATEIMKANTDVLNRVDKSLTTFEVKISGEIDSLKKSVTEIDDRLDKAGI